MINSKSPLVPNSAIENILKAEMEVNTQELNELMDDFDINDLMKFEKN